MVSVKREVQDGIRTFRPLIDAGEGYPNDTFEYQPGGRPPRLFLFGGLEFSDPIRDTRIRRPYRLLPSRALNANGLYLINSDLDQAVTLTWIAYDSNAPATAHPALAGSNTQWIIAAGNVTVQRIAISTQLWAPWSGLYAQCTTAPTVGGLSVLAVLQ